jgi:hypothetical protein
MKTLFTLLFALIGLAQAQTPDVEHRVVYHREDEFAAWPGTEGLWSWGDEILVGFNVAKFEERGDKHSLVGGHTWSTEITLRADGRKWDLGYTRAALRPDGRIVILYYFSTDQIPQQHIEAAIWRP